MAIFIPFSGLEACKLNLKYRYRSKSILCNTEKVVRMTGSTDGIQSNVHMAISSILEADRKRHTRGQFTVKLGFSCSCAW